MEATTPVKSYVGPAIRALREGKLTQRALAERMHVPTPSLSRLESGRIVPREDTIRSAADALGTTIVALFKKADELRKAAQDLE